MFRGYKRGCEKVRRGYEVKPESQRPCDNDELRKIHGTALEKGEGYFMTETVGISTSTTEKYLNKLKVGIKMRYCK